tara:strand:+ start:5175 stop:5441 length:267 start_codon:yes stop_codon:yes gene_type:complete
MDTHIFSVSAILWSTKHNGEYIHCLSFQTANDAPNASLKYYTELKAKYSSKEYDIDFDTVVSTQISDLSIVKFVKDHGLEKFCSRIEK